MVIHSSLAQGDSANGTLPGAYHLVGRSATWIRRGQVWVHHVSPCFSRRNRVSFECPIDFWNPGCPALILSLLSYTPLSFQRMVSLFNRSAPLVEEWSVEVNADLVLGLVPLAPHNVAQRQIGQGLCTFRAWKGLVLST